MRSNERRSERLKEWIESSPNDVKLDEANATTLSLVESLFKETATIGTVDQNLRNRWNKLGWTIHEMVEDGILIIKETAGQERGRGVYAIRTNAKLNVMLQAPHRYYDERTGAIVRQLFAENDIFAAAWNSSHRSQIDLAHEPLHDFNAFSDAISNGETRVIQLHGFDAMRRDRRLQSTDVILSNSTRFPDRFVMQTAIGLKELLGRSAVRVFPLETEDLGGTKNAQAELLRRSGIFNFLHVEMGADYRLELVKSASSRREFAAALLSAAPNPDKQPKP